MREEREKNEVVTALYTTLNKNRLTIHDLIDVLGDQYKRKTYEELSAMAEILYREINNRLIKCVEEVLEMEIARTRP